MLSKLKLPALLMIAMPVCAHASVIQDVRASPAEIQPGERLEISFRLAEPAATAVAVFDSDLRHVRRIDLGRVEPGVHVATWDATDDSGGRVLPEAYSWTIFAKTKSAAETWEPAGLHSRVAEQIGHYQWDPVGRLLSYRVPAAMRVWIRIGVNMGACLRVLVEGEPRPAGLVSETWEGFDDTGSVNVQSQPNWGIAIFGFRLPQPCVIVSGGPAAPRPTSGDRFLSLLVPPIGVEEPAWQRRRAFRLTDRLRPELQVLQLDPRTFAASLKVPGELAGVGGEMLQNALAHPVRLKWYVDGHCASEEVDASLPALVTLRPDQLPPGRRHFITANLLTALDSILVASRWVE